MNAIRMFRQNWSPDWRLDPTEDLANDVVGTSQWKANNPLLPLRTDGSGNALQPTSTLSSGQMRPYYFDPGCPAVGQSGVAYGGYKGRTGSWLSFDTARFEFGHIPDASNIALTAPSGSFQNLWVAPASGFLVGIVYGWYPYDANPLYWPTNCGIFVRVNEDDSRKIKMPLTDYVEGSYGDVSRKRFSFYLYTNAYDTIEVSLEQWDASGDDVVYAYRPFAYVTWKEAKPANGPSSELPVAPGNP